VATHLQICRSFGFDTSAACGTRASMDHMRRNREEVTCKTCLRTSEETIRRRIRLRVEGKLASICNEFYFSISEEDLVKVWRRLVKRELEREKLSKVEEVMEG